MNDLDQLSAISDLEASRLVSDEAFAQLADQITAQLPRAAPSALRRRQVRLPLAVAAGVAAAALAAGSILLAVRSPEGRSIAASPVPSSAPRPSVPVGPLAAPSAAAAQLVTYATRQAATETFNPQPDQWMYTDVRMAEFPDAPRRGHVAVDPPFKPVDFQQWLRVDGKKEADIEGGKLVRNAMAGGPFAHDPGEVTFGWSDLRYPYLESLPVSPAQLTEVIESTLAAQNNGHALPPGVIPGTSGIAIFEAVEALEGNVPVLPPALQAGLYGVLAHDPAVSFDPSVTDYAGQTGAAFSASLDNGQTQDSIIVNTRTYAYMGLQETALKTFTRPGGAGTYLYHKGAVLNLQAVLAAGIVRYPGQRPGRK